MPELMTLPRHVDESAASLGTFHGVAMRLQPTGYVQPLIRLVRSPVYYAVFVAPAPSPADSRGGKELEEYVDRIASENLELSSKASRPAGTSTSPLARAARMNPWAA